MDQALCFGWIDGIRRGIDDSSYAIRFTPRKRRSTWSRVNVRRAEELKKMGLMRPAGLAAFEAREKSGVYSYEQKDVRLGQAYEQQFKEHPSAWEFFSAQPPWYRRTATWWVISAKKEETRQRRLAQLIESSSRAETVPPLTRPRKK